MLATKTDTKAALADAAKKLGVAESDITVVTDDTLIGGYILRSKDQRIDASYKRSLLALYHRITHTD
jgi:F0F1-type ATP synthase delta subunit